MRSLNGENAIKALDEIHAVMSIPHQWSASTPEHVADVLYTFGYTFPEENDVDELEDAEGPDAEALIKQHRAPR